MTARNSKFYYKLGRWPSLEEAKEFDKTIDAELLVKKPSN